MNPLAEPNPVPELPDLQSLTLEQEKVVAEDPSPFLSLPRELRNAVLEHLVDEEHPAPQDPDCAGRRAASVPQVPAFIFYEAASPRLTLLQVKLCNRQMYAEVKDFLKKCLAKDDVAPFLLDIMIKGNQLWPTWVSLPAIARTNIVIDVNLRIWEISDACAAFNLGARRGLSALIDLLVANGPYLNTGVRLSSPLSISILSFDALFHFDDPQADPFVARFQLFDEFQKIFDAGVGQGCIQKLQVYQGEGNGRQWKMKEILPEPTFDRFGH